MDTKKILRSLIDESKEISVLYVEDDLEIRERFCLFLKKFFSNITMSSNGEEGLELYKNNNYDIVITDINMPKMNGLHMSKEIKKINPQQHIIIVSAHQDVENFIEAIKVGVEGYILKPVEYEQLSLVLLKSIRTVKATKENEIYQNYLEKTIIEKKKELEKKYIYDELTMLHNKAYLLQKLSLDIEQTIIFLNIDNFGLINHNFGYKSGDDLLVLISKVLQSFEDKEFKLFRFQGDEFVFLANTVCVNKAKALANKINEYFNSNSLLLSEFTVDVSFTIAIDAGNSNLLKNSAITVESLRQYGKNRLGIYQKDNDFEIKQINNLYWIKKLKESLKNGELTIFLQPIQNINDRKIRKYEALARIVPDYGDIIMPSSFIEPAILSGLSSEITKLVIDKGLSAIKDNKNITLSFNITQDDFDEEYLLTYLLDKCKKYKVATNQVILEILETASIDKGLKSISQIKELKKQGFQVAIDDFGTQMSNFSRLLDIKADYIKIDGSFVKTLLENGSSEEIVKAITTFAHKIGSKVIAEFVCSEDIFNRLKELDVDFAQGYHIEKPLPLNEMNFE